jgi:hypothetical protein
VVEPTTPAPAANHKPDSARRTPEALQRKIQGSRQRDKERRKLKAARSPYLRGLDWILNNLNKVPALDQIPKPIRSGIEEEDEQAERDYAQALLKRDAILDGLRQQQTGEFFNLYVEMKRSLATQEKFCTYYLSENSKAEAAERKQAEPVIEWGDDARKQFQLIDAVYAEAPELKELAEEYHARNRKHLTFTGLTVPRVTAVSPIASAPAVVAVEVDERERGGGQT